MSKRFVVLGLGETGLASALFLKKRGYDVFVSDTQTSSVLKKRSDRLQSEKIPFELGGHTLPKILEADWVLISPGISPAAPVYQVVRSKGIPLVSEIEVASWFFKGEVIAVTGTSGKTTVTTLVHRLLQANGIKSVACGNIGNPWIGEVDRLAPSSQVVLEVSSFQLLHTYSFRPRYGILINLGLNHLDWHPTLEDYVAAKLRLFQNQNSEDVALIRRRDREKYFPDYCFKGNVVYWGEEGPNDNEAILHELTRLKRLASEKTREVLSKFEGLEHRLERLGELDGVHFVNDSKCTTLEALAWALARFPDKRVILLAGGHAKASDFRSVRDPLTRKARQVVIFGEAQDLLWKNWEGTVPLVQARDLREAFGQAIKTARPGDIVLLSPACASFDQFSNYKERGELFKRLVQEARERDRTTIVR